MTPSLTDRLTAAEGTHFLPGLQALVRVPLEQARLDRADGLRIGTFISGYPGSPLAGFDLALSRVPDLLASHDVTFLPAGNEELAATAHMGTQMLDDHPHARWDGVTSIWYGKGPGVDRSGDALKHGNFAGTSRHGAVVILSGEDHEAKSSTMPYQQEYAFTSAGIPVLYPASVAQVREFGLHAIRLSRYSGCWVALKLTSALCDGGETVTFTPGDVPVRIPDVRIDGVPFAKRTDFSFFPGKNIEMERHLYQERHLAVLGYARANGLNEVIREGAGDTVGIITAGKSATDVAQALHDLGVDEPALGRAGVRVLRMGLVYPVDEELLRRFATGLDRVIVVEEKRDFLERHVKAALQPLGRPIEVVGKTDGAGRPLFPVAGGMDADLIATQLARLLEAEFARAGIAARAARHTEQLELIARREHAVSAGRTPNFCSGCPHSASTVLAEGQVAWGSPGCNCFNTVIEQPKRHIDVMTQYGGEGLPWIGLARYTDREHMVQHIGDGAIYHSSYLNIRWAVAAGVNITFKLLYNGVVANTGAQNPVGSRGLAELTRGLESEGVAEIVIVTKEPSRYRGARLAPGVRIKPADQLVATAAELAKVSGTTVMIYDESCANERRRLQRRGKLATPDRHVLVNTDVCENCGDCGAQSNCMSLQKVPTEFGDKTRVHPSSCNQDFSCLVGDCPAFVTVHTAPGTGYRKPETPELGLAELPEPARSMPPTQPFRVHMPGVGGTGVLTLNAMLSVAATLDGYRVLSYDQTGAAQKWGPVVSSLVLLPPGAAGHAHSVGRGGTDLYVALDEVGAAASVNLDRCSPERTRAVLNTDLFPTGEQIRDVHAEIDSVALHAAIAAQCRDVLGVPARRIAEELFGDYMLTNVVAIGAAYQAGVLPIDSARIEEAIGLNGVAVRANLQAFRYGRLWVHDRDRISRRLEPAKLSAADERDRCRAALRPRRRAAYDRLWAATAELDEETRRLLAVRLAELVDYQDERYASRYLDTVLGVARREREVAPHAYELSHAAARNLYKLMAYKDEYEVARLYLKPAFAGQISATFTDPIKVVNHLQPPAARRFGTSKVAVGPWFRPVFRVLRAARGLRGTRLDPFRRQSSRVQERLLIDWYRGLLDLVVAELRVSNHGIAVALAAVPDQIRGYEQVKDAGARAARQRAEELAEELRRPRLPLTSTAR